MKDGYNGAPITVMLDRLLVLSDLLLAMTSENNTKKFFEMDRQFKDLVKTYELEDELNGYSNHSGPAVI